MKPQKLLLGLLTLFTFSNLSAQYTFGTESFGTGAAQGTLANSFVGDLGTWTTVSTGTNNASANEWYVSGEECGGLGVTSCGTGCSGGNNTLHVSAIGGLCGGADCGAAYDATAAPNITNKRAMSPNIDCSTLFGIVLSFDYIAAQGDDGFWVEYSVDGGTTWLTFTGGVVAGSMCCDCDIPAFCAGFGLCCGGGPVACGLGQGYWANVSLNFPAAADDNATVQFAFHWSNDGNGVGTDPSVAIDDIVLTHATALAVELKSFEGSPVDNTNFLTWKTLSESNSDYFELEHSIDGMNFEVIGKVKANGTTNKEQSYSHFHEVETESNFYRMRMVDVNGNYSRSNVIYVENDLSGIFVTQTSEEFVIKGLADLNGSFTVYNLGGQVVRKAQLFNRDDAEARFLHSHFGSGMYVVGVNTNEGIKKFKILVP